MISLARAELLIVKQSEEGSWAFDYYKPISEPISNIILKYQWPMCIASQLSADEANKLFAEEPYAEEQFIQGKIRETVGKEYSVIFVPTVLYDLFSMLQIFKTKGQTNVLQKALNEFFLAYATSTREKPNPYRIGLKDIINRDIIHSAKDAQIIRKAVFAVYHTTNQLFMDKGLVWSFINEKFSKWLFEMYPELGKYSQPLVLSQAIKENSSDITTKLIDEIRVLPRQNYYLPYISRDDANLECPSKTVAALGREQETKFLEQIIALEYDARERNRALLFRGTSLFEIQIGLDPEKKTLIGTTIRKTKDVPLERSYIEKALEPYSISYGNTLFALRDCTASAYTYFNEEKFGYVLFIDKKAYYDHQIQNLFFIPPLMSLASLVQKGEFFHPRTKAAVHLKNGKEFSIEGLATPKIKDPTGVLLITRDPLKHAELFSKYLAENSELIIAADKRLSDKDKKIVEEIKKRQAEAAEYYRTTQKSTQKLARFVKKITKKTFEQNKLLGLDQLAADLMATYQVLS